MSEPAAQRRRSSCRGAASRSAPASGARRRGPAGGRDRCEARPPRAGAGLPSRRAPPAPAPTATPRATTCSRRTSSCRYETPIDSAARDGARPGHRAQATANGFKIRVAVIAQQDDLGARLALFAKPQQYAKFLGQELDFVYPGRLLVAMPNGYGYAQGGRPTRSSRTRCRRCPSRGRTGRRSRRGRPPLIGQLAEAAGIPLPESAVSAESSGGSDRTLIAAGIAALVAALALVALAVVLIRRGRRAPSP